MAKRKPKFEYFIVCDDIRQELGNKLSFMGVYGDEIFVPSFPFTFSQLSVAIKYRNLKSGDFFSIETKDPSGKKIGETVKGSAPKDVKKSLVLTIHATFASIKISEEGSLQITIVFNDDKSTKKEITIPIKERK